MFRKDKIHSMITSLKCGGTRKGNMLLFGATIGRTRHPLFMFNNKIKILPRPVVSCRYGNRGHDVYNLDWFKELVQSAENNVNLYIKENITSFLRFSALKINVNRSKLIIPMDLRISNSIFTSCSVVGSLYNGICYTHLHVDKNDIISTVFVFGEVENGGDSIFYDGLSAKEPGMVVHVKKFKNGMSITGDFSSILHGASLWKGYRLAIVFFINKKILKHFSLFGDYYYKHYRYHNHPSGYFMTDGQKTYFNKSNHP